MQATEPKNATEKRLMKKENWKLADIVDAYWMEEECRCDICHNKISGRHMIDGKRSGILEFALMCAQCHSSYGEGFGEGKGQLYTHLVSGKWLQTFGFTEYQLAEAQEDDRDDY